VSLQDLLPALMTISWQQVVMIAVGLVLIYLAIAKEYEPTLLLPMGFGTLLVNIPLSSAAGAEGVLTLFFKVGIATEIFPLLIFIAIGAMIDFSPLFARPFLLLFGAAAQFGIFATMAVAAALGFDLRQAASIGIIGAADGPTSIVVASLVTILLGISISSTMAAERFVRVDTLMIIGLGLLAFIFDTAGGSLFAKVINVFLPADRRINPMLGACGISAFPMSARVIHTMGQKEDPFNYLLMPAVSANVSGQIGSVVAGGLLLSLVPLFL
jgi:Na+-transporting methylmalonyl-CoA/oxaloacetate decarboxylase beta subunit